MNQAHQLPALVGIVEAVDAEGEVVYAASLPDGPIVVLRGTALLIWQEALSPSDGRALADRVADVYDVPVNRISSVVDSCVADLVAQGILEAVFEK